MIALMGEDDRARLIQELESSRDTLVASVAGMSEEEAALAVPPGWSAMGIVEHCAIVGQVMLDAIESANEPNDLGDRTRFEASIMKHGASRTRKIEAPAAMRPSGAYSTLAEALTAFQSVQERAVEFVQSAKTDLREHTFEHVIGRITARECLLLIIQHPRRHAGQILEQRRPSESAAQAL